MIKWIMLSLVITASICTADELPMQIQSQVKLTEMVCYVARREPIIVGAERIIRTIGFCFPEIDLAESFQPEYFSGEWTWTISRDSVLALDPTLPTFRDMTSVEIVKTH